MKHWKSALVLAFVFATVASPRAEAGRKVLWRTDAQPDGYAYDMTANLTGTNAHWANRDSSDDLVLYAPHAASVSIIGSLDYQSLTFMARMSGAGHPWISASNRGYYLAIGQAVGSGVDSLVANSGVCVYYSTYEGEIRKIDTHGTNDVHVLWPATRVSDMAFAGNKLWWTDGQGIHSANANGTGAELIIPGNFTLCGLDVDTTFAHRIFYSCPFAGVGRLYAATLDGSDTLQMYSGALEEFGYPRTDGQGYVYWADRAHSSIKKSWYTGGGAATIVNGASLPTPANQLAIQYGPSSCQRFNTMGDIVSPYGAPDFTDISTVVDCFLGNWLGSRDVFEDWDLCDLYPCGTIAGETTCIGDGVVDFNDISQEVANFLGDFSACP